MPQPERRTMGLGVMLLASQLMNVGVYNIPPVTLFTIMAQVVIYLRLVNVEHWWWHETRDVCVSSYLVWHRRQWRRLVMATFDHADDMHLYYNMVSFLWKGISLERRYGGRKFVVVLAVFSVAVNVVYVALAELASEITDDFSYSRQCAVGFSGVLFALKVLTTAHTPNATQNVLGMWIPVKWGVWFELVLIQVMVPNASFLGHLAGIIVGIAYTSGPLRSVVALICGMLDVGFNERRPPSYTYQAGPSGRR